MKSVLTRCAWASKASPLEIGNHDEEWGVPSYDDRHLFEMLILEGAQAGMSWATILKKREGYRSAFDGFDPEKIARYTPAKRHKLLQDSGIVRNRLKIESAVGNANAYLALRAAGNTLSSILWGFVDGKPVQNQWRTQDQVPASTPQSDWVLPRSRRRDRAIPTSSWVHI